MKITVVLCTYNRCRSLSAALESIAASELDKDVHWEVLVVDNHSSDNTAQVVEDFRRRYPGRFRYAFERRRGLSHARNTGVLQSAGDIIAFTDDDIAVEKSWLNNLTSQLRTGDWAAAGGRILAARKFVAPPWLATEGPYGMGGILFAHFDLGDQAREMDQPPHGANMAFRREVFDRYGYFRTDLGPSPGDTMPNEDTEFGRRLLANGEHLFYEPSAVVYHEIAESRLSQRYFLKWWFDYGRAQVREAGKRPSILGIPRRYISITNLVLSHLPRRTLQWLATGDLHKRFYRRCMVQVAAGWLVETYRLGDLAPISQDAAEEAHVNNDPKPRTSENKVVVADDQREHPAQA